VATHARHDKIGAHASNLALGYPKQLQRLLAILGPVDLITGLGQRSLEEAPRTRLVVNHPNRLRHFLVPGPIWLRI
jgi:hypothetical protein